MNEQQDSNPIEIEDPDANSWPNKIGIEAFRRTWVLEGTTVWETVFEMHRDKMQIKNVNVAIANLENIFTTTFKLTAEKGFQAMSLRDLSRETGISMGGLYSYIGSKNELASVIEDVLRHYTHKVIGSLENHELDPVSHLRAVVFGEMYMNEIMNPWFYFCFMELKGLPREQQERAMSLELDFESLLTKILTKGIEQNIFVCANPGLLATHTLGMLQQWYLKRWKFRNTRINVEIFADSILKTILKNLEYQGSVDKLPAEKLRNTL